MKKTNKKKKRAFTIVELVIVIAVIAILAAVLIPTFSNVIKKANHSAALQEARNKYLEVYADDIANDGVLNGSVAETDDKGYTYTTAGGEVTGFTFEKNGITVEYDVANDKWTVEGESQGGTGNGGTDNEDETPGTGETTCEHPNASDDDDCTTDIICPDCTEVAVPGADNHTGGEATCTDLAVCETCGTAYGETIPHFDNPPKDGKCDACGTDVDHECVDEDTDHKCDICTKDGMGTHEAASDSHDCAYCKEKVTDCADTTPKDHECDVCGTTVGDAHEAASGRHNCAYCGGAITECTYDNGVCTVCGATDPNYQPSVQSVTLLDFTNFDQQSVTGSAWSGSDSTVSQWGTENGQFFTYVSNFDGNGNYDIKIPHASVALGDYQYLCLWMDLTNVAIRKACFGLISGDTKYATDNTTGDGNTVNYPLYFYYLADGSDQWVTKSHGGDGCFGAAEGTSVQENNFKGWFAFPIKDMSCNTTTVIPPSSTTEINQVYFFFSIKDGGYVNQKIYMDNIGLYANYTDVVR